MDTESITSEHSERLAEKLSTVFLRAVKDSVFARDLLEDPQKALQSADPTLTWEEIQELNEFLLREEQVARLTVWGYVWGVLKDVEDRIVAPPPPPPPPPPTDFWPPEALVGRAAKWTRDRVIATAKSKVTTKTKTKTKAKTKKKARPVAKRKGRRK